MTEQYVTDELIHHNRSNEKLTLADLRVAVAEAQRLGFSDEAEVSGDSFSLFSLRLTHRRKVSE